LVLYTGDGDNIECKKAFEKTKQEKDVEGTPILPIIIVFITLLLGADAGFDPDCIIDSIVFVSEFFVGHCNGSYLADAEGSLSLPTPESESTSTSTSTSTAMPPPTRVSNDREAAFF
jgi:hypothetical protein